MNRSSKNPDAYDEIREDALTEQKWKWPVAPDGMSATVNARLQEQAARITSLESELKTMTSAADDRIREDASVLGRTCGYCNFTGDMMAYAQHVCPRDVMQSEIDSLRAQLAAAGERERELREICSGIVQREWDAYLTQNGAFLPACDYCRSARTYGHTVDCLIGRLAAALAAAQQEEGK